MMGTCFVTLCMVQPMERVAKSERVHRADSKSTAVADTVAVRVRLHRRGTVWPTRAQFKIEAVPTMVRGGGAHECCRLAPCGETATRMLHAHRKIRLLSGKRIRPQDTRGRRW